MSLLQPELTSCHRPSCGSKVAGSSLVIGAALLLVGGGFTLGTQRSAAPYADPCGLPAGVSTADLDHEDAALITRQLLACNDLRSGRIDRAQYQTIAARRPERATPDPAGSIIWASSVRDFSTQYSATAWSANQLLGAPDVFPAHGDHAKAWASQGADDRSEHVEVGFDRPTVASAVVIYETFNPGAIDHIELVTESGRRISKHPNLQKTAEGTSIERMIHLDIDEPIVAVRVFVDSQAVAGWNEIDAIGLVVRRPSPQR